MDVLFPLLSLSFIYLLFRFYHLVSQRRNQSCYVLAYECFKGGEDMKLKPSTCVKLSLQNENLGIEEYRFLLKSVVNSDIGEHTYAPRNIISGQPFPTHAETIKEMEEIFYRTLDKLFDRTGISPSQVDILVVNVALLAPAPSLAAHIINHYKMKPDVKVYNLSAMGCSANIISIDLVRNLFKQYKNKIAVVVSTESTGPNWYQGTDKSMMLSNCLFRSGGCSILLTNNPALKEEGILKVHSLVRRHIGSNDEAYRSCIREEDGHGYVGIRIDRTILKAASIAISENLRILLPQVLPITEILRYLLVLFLYKRLKLKHRIPKVSESLNLKTGIDHFCIHPGGRTVIDQIGKSLGLDDYDLEPSKMVLHWFGNTSTSSIWYVLSYLEAKKRLKKGQRVLMIGIGAGFKCNTCVLEIMRDMEDMNIWKDCTESFPLKTSNPFADNLSWVYDPCMNFVRFH